MTMENKYIQYSNLNLVAEFKRIFDLSGVSRSNISRFIKNHYP